MKKKHIGELISVKFKDRKDCIYGIVVDYNDDWTLMKYNPVDYVIDGYIILKNKNIKGFRRDTEEKFKEKVVRLKGLMPTDSDTIPITDIETILNFVTNKFGVFQLYTKSETACYLGRLVSFEKKLFVIDFLNTNGQWSGEMAFKTSEIRVIEFDTDYINSLKLVLVDSLATLSRHLK